jgi:hypothetical protein
VGSREAAPTEHVPPNPTHREAVQVRPTAPPPHQALPFRSPRSAPLPLAAPAANRYTPPVSRQKRCASSFAAAEDLSSTVMILHIVQFERLLRSIAFGLVVVAIPSAVALVTETMSVRSRTNAHIQFYMYDSRLVLSMAFESFLRSSLHYKLAAEHTAGDARLKPWEINSTLAKWANTARASEPSDLAFFADLPQRSFRDPASIIVVRVYGTRLAPLRTFAQYDISGMGPYADAEKMSDILVPSTFRNFRIPLSFMLVGRSVHVDCLLWLLSITVSALLYYGIDSSYRSVIRRRRAGRKLCVQCGYPASGTTCPECGAMPTLSE